MRYIFPVWIKAGFLIVLFIIVAFGASFYTAQKQAMTRQAEARLASIARLKVDEIAAWRKERLNDGAEVTTRPYLVEHMLDWLARPQEQNRQKLLTEFGIIQQQGKYINILLVDANGDVRLSQPGPTEVSKEYAAELSAAFKSHVPVMSELNIDANLPKPHIAVVAPLFAKDEPARPIGAVILLIDPSRFLYPLIQSWPIPSKSAEALLVRRDGDDVLFLNTLRHQPGTALKLRIPLSRSDLPAAMAIKGKQEIATGRDYRGVKVVSVLLPVPGSAWFMVAKMDASDIFAPWRSQAVLSIALFASTLVILAVFALFTWQHEQKKHYLALYKSEAELRAATQRHSVTLKSIGDAVIVTDAHGRVELLNSVAEALTGWSHEAACGRPLKEVFHIVNEHTRSLVENPVLKVMRDGVVVGLANHTILIDKNGNERPIADSGAPIRDADDGITGVVLVFRDQSEGRAYQRQLLESEQQIRLALEAAELGTWRHDPATGSIRLDHRGQLCYGFSKEAVTLAEVIERVHPDDAERLEKEIDSVNDPKSGLDRFETQYRVIHPDGNIRWLSTSLRKYISGSADQKKLSGLTYGTVRDVTDRKQAQDALRNLNQNLERQVAERTALAESRSRQLQSLAVELIEAEEGERRRVAQLLHEDLQQVLAAARFQLQGIGENGLSSKAEIANIEKLLEESISKSRRLSHELSPPVLHYAGLAAALDWLGRQMAEQFGLKVELKVAAEHQFANAPLKVFMFRAVQELLFNVFKHSGAKNAFVELSVSGQDLVITVSDQGRGFDPAILDPSTTTGGLGLLSLRERANYVGGSLIVESMAGRGSRFVLKVPSRLSALQESGILLCPNGQPPIKVTVNAEKADIRLLFADDHKVMRQGLIQLVSGQPNIQVVGQAANGKEALELVRELQPDVVLMDVSMPDMDGIEATRRIKSEFPNVRIIGLSMYEDEHIGRTMCDAGAEKFLAKTTSPGELLKAIYAIASR